MIIIIMILSMTTVNLNSSVVKLLDIRLKLDLSFLKLESNPKFFGFRITIKSIHINSNSHFKPFL